MVSRAMVTAGWLSGALKTKKAPSLRVLDSTWYAPGGRDARKEFTEKHIPGAAFFDMEQCKDEASPYEMMLPSRTRFADYAGSLGINNQSHVVIYDCDNMGMLYAPRLWWMFRVFGHSNVSVLDGGLVNWEKRNLPVTSEIAAVKPEKFDATLDRSLLKTFEDVQENLSSKRFQLVDARGAARFRGPEPKPGEGIEPGHIPGSLNLPFAGFLTPDGFQKPSHEIRRLFEEKEVDLRKPLAATCRRGVTASHLALAAFVLGKEDAAVYDGSWSEWFHRAKPEHKVFEGRSQA
ncbi:thiosulfate sulfurtransferase-like [Rana temporaria]|uniref:thiosulfate sulfurtransferase-like n=1 Tax=Rana temporaria TaxID=8407 RepID=UPI001AADAA01|nr:thiosulfate sulfurtransferase-like [Rana temporaria]